MTDTTGSAADYLPIRHLFVDEQYQRDLNLRWVLDRVRDYDRALLGALEVSDRGPAAEPGRRYAVIDGRHRLELAGSADPDGEDTVLLCNVHQGLTPEQEAALFYQIDAGRRRLTGWDRWKARRAAGDQAVVDIERVVGQHELRLVNTTSPRHNTRRAITSTAACEHIVALGGLPLLSETLDVCVAAWSSDHSFARDPLEAVALVLHHYPRDTVPLPRLIDACSAITMVQLLARAKAMREHATGTNLQLAASILVQLLNSRRGSTGGKLLEPFASVLQIEKKTEQAAKRPAPASVPEPPAPVDITPTSIAERAAALRRAKPAPGPAEPVQPRTKDDGRKWGICRACSTTITVRGDCGCTREAESA